MADYDRLVAQETLIFEATEEICRAMEGEQDSGTVTRKELAKRLGCGKSHVTQLLSGDRNLTLRTVADLASALGHKATITFELIPAPPGEKPPAGEVEGLREALEEIATSEEEGSGFGPETRTVYPFGQKAAERAREALDAFPPPSDSQGEQGRCKTCGGTKLVSQRFGTGQKTAPMPCSDCSRVGKGAFIGDDLGDGLGSSS